MKIKDLWVGCPVFLTLNLGRTGTVSYLFLVEAWDPESKLFTIRGLTDVLFGKHKIGVARGWREDGWHYWEVSGEFFTMVSSLPSKLDAGHDYNRDRYVADLKRWRESNKQKESKKDV
jgi:hypothetical protein